MRRVCGQGVIKDLWGFSAFGFAEFRAKPCKPKSLNPEPETPNPKPETQHQEVQQQENATAAVLAELAQSKARLVSSGMQSTGICPPTLDPTQRNPKKGLGFRVKLSV